MYQYSAVWRLLWSCGGGKKWSGKGARPVVPSVEVLVAYDAADTMAAYGDLKDMSAPTSAAFSL